MPAPDGGHDEPISIPELSFLSRLIQCDRNRSGGEIAGGRIGDDEPCHADLEAPRGTLEDVDRCLVGDDPRDVVEGQARPRHRVHRAARDAIDSPAMDLLKHEAPVVKPPIQHVLHLALLGQHCRDGAPQRPAPAGDDGRHRANGIELKNPAGLCRFAGRGR